MSHPVGGPVVSKIRIRPQTRVPLQRNEQQGTRRLKEMEVAAKVVRRDPDHRMRDAIDRHGFPDDVGIGCHPALPEVMAQDDARLGRWRVVDRGIETRSARERHAKRAEVVGRHVQRRHTRGRLRLVRSRLAELAGLPGPPRDGHAGIGVAQRLIVRIGPLFERPHAGFGAERTEREHQELGQPVGVDAARRRRDRAGEGRERDERAHADAERDDADQRERSVLGERPCGMSQVASDRMERIQGALRQAEKRWCIESVRDLLPVYFTIQRTLCKLWTSAVRREFLSHGSGWTTLTVAVHMDRFRARATPTAGGLGMRHRDRRRRGDVPAVLPRRT